MSEVIFKGEPVTELPQDLYIPPDALEVILETFEGPLDLLLYLIKRHNLDILDIPITQITEQYIQYINMMKSLRLELASEYLVMAAMLAEIKSRLLLPTHETIADDETDPRAELIRRLQAYECFKKAAEDLDQLPRQDRDFWPITVDAPQVTLTRPKPAVELKDLLMAFAEVMSRAKLMASHHVQREPLSIRERMSQVLTRLTSAKHVMFTQLFCPEEGRLGVVVTFIAILELVKQSMIELIQTDPLTPIHVKAIS